MIKKLCLLSVFSFMTVSSFLSAEIDYDIQDIGTLQTHSSQAIALNNQGQILGWYNIDGTTEGKHFFVRDQDGSFYELPLRENGNEINWKYLTEDGRAYGTFDGNATFAVLYMWDQQNGVVKLGNLPGKEISSINNAGQVLIKSITEQVPGGKITRPVIWHNGVVTKLKGLSGNIGIESDESYGFSMNNNGEVVGKSLVFNTYKNKVYKQIHAAKWVNGQAIDLHDSVQKTSRTSAIAINDLGDILIESPDIGISTVVGKDGICHKVPGYHTKINNKVSTYQESELLGIDGKYLTAISWLDPKIQKDANSNWMKVNKFIAVNGNDEIIAEGETIYGEKHAMFLTPIKSQ